MCGINGIISKNISNTVIDNVIKMNSILNHRGPDASEVWSNDSAVFGYTQPAEGKKNFKKRNQKKKSKKEIKKINVPRN